MKPTPQLAVVPPEELPPWMRESFERSRALRGDATFIQVAGNAPEVYEWYMDFYKRVFYGGRVPVRIKELVRLKLSTVHGCAFCNKGNRVAAAEAGLSAEQMAALDDPDAAVWSPAERAAIKLASQMVLTNPRGYLSSPLYGELREHFDDAQLFELGMTMAVLTGVAKFIFAYDLVEKEDYCPFPGAADQDTAAASA